LLFGTANRAGFRLIDVNHRGKEDGTKNEKDIREEVTRDKVHIGTTDADSGPTRISRGESVLCQ
jgi:hypothetical protein